MRKLKLLGIVLILLLAASAILLWISQFGAGDSTAWKSASSLEEWGQLAYGVNHPAIAGFLLVILFGIAFFLANYIGKLMGGLLGLVAGLLIGWKRFGTVSFMLGLATGLCVILAAQLLSATYKLHKPFPWLLLLVIIGWMVWREERKRSPGVSEADRKVERWYARGHLAGMLIMSVQWIANP